MEKRNCKQCGINFEIGDWDLEFLKKMAPTYEGKKFDISLPTLCSDCRRQRRLIWRDHKFLYKRECDLCHKETVTTYSKEKVFPVYCQDCWWSDKWDPLSYGRDFDFSRPFFEQFGEMLRSVPRLALMNKSPENSEFCNNAGRNKNCYLCNGGCWDNEECAYGIRVNRCKDCVENRMLTDSELCLRDVFGENLYKCSYCHHCFNSRDCYFSVNLIGCDHCVFSSNLNNKKYYAFNKPCSEEEFDKIIEQMKSHDGLEKLEEEFAEMLQNAVYPPTTKKNCEDCSGDYIHDCKNAIEAYDGWDLENVKYFFIGEDCKDAMDVTSAGMQGSQLLYECMSTGVGAFNCMFGHGNWTARENLYCDTVMSCSNCFGSTNLKHKQFCILNKQYTQEEYEKIVAKIIEHMRKTGEWGEFFPISLAVFDYNESIANEYYPLNKDEAEKLGAKWKNDDAVSESDLEYFIPKDNVENPENNVEELLKGIIECEVSGKPFRLNPVEVKFFLNNQIAIPRKHYEIRYDELASVINSNKLYHRKCMNGGCSNEFETTYAPDRTEKIYCEDCYQKSVL